MVILLSIVLLGLVAEPGPVPGVPAPPSGRYEAELTKLAAERAKTELASQLAQVLNDPMVPAGDKAEAKARAASARLKLAIYTSDRSLEETAAFYGQKIPGASFLFAERNVLIDLADVARGSKIQIPAEVQREWQDKSGRTARWTREDQMLQISIEDYLIDPRDGKVTKKTVVLVTSMAP